MKKIFPLLLLFVMGFTIETGDEKVFANSKETTPYYEDHSVRVGYKTVDEAVSEFEKNCDCVVKLPAMIPDLKFTHEFGAYYKDHKDRQKDLLQIRFVNREQKNNIFKIDVRPSKVSYEGKEYTLQDGSKGIYVEHHIFHVFVFEKNNLQYIVRIDKNASDIDPSKALMDVANSVN
ncbi:carbon monoxide dehydrogenase [Ureibacillus chungkukjangi]|uniref:Uncharacterized protein n=1 Tax=Ureibacillus chungkukjangi TaxID=1202712 RepID=A0A318TR01_9BACL|nr:carbon monoxide dehydrogenase [Ureibacillus chungkukjangi]PYF06773.1 hypothetical protein BJ095_1075 [Ureibacillus chungkukjangi]